MQKLEFSGIVVSLASADDIAQWSHGAVDNPGTINFVTGMPKQHGLFCETIFGPIKNYECSCGKYSGARYKGIVCDKCGVEVTTSRVRRSRMGHIDLVSPVIHPWYKFTISKLLQLSYSEIDRILVFIKYTIPENVSENQRKQLIDELDRTLQEKLKELEILYKSEKDEIKYDIFNHKKLSEIEKLYERYKSQFTIEFSRLKSIVSNLHFGSTILENDYRNIFYKYTNIVKFVSGPEGILEMLKNIDVKKEIKGKLEDYSNSRSAEQKKNLMGLIKLLINLYTSGVKPENMVLKKLPVIPADLRPEILLSGYKFICSDINSHYKKVLIRNHRLKSMIKMGLPIVTLKNGIKSLQESVDSLFNGESLLRSNIINTENDDEFEDHIIITDNDGHNPSLQDDKKILGIKDILTGEEGVFKKNLLGKRVDYSGRSVVTVGPNLKLDECELPISMALNIFKFFIVAKLIDKKVVYTPMQAAKLIREKSPIALKILNEIINDKHIILNRTPSLYQSRIKAFKIKLTTSKVIRISPLMFHDLYSSYECLEVDQHSQFDDGYGLSDFDNGGLSVHLPLSVEAQKEAKTLIASNKNILNTSCGDINIINSNEIILGIYYLTDLFDKRYPDYDTEKKWLDNIPITGYFDSINKVLKLFESEDINEKDKIILQHNSSKIITTVGRVIFNSILPPQLSFINKTRTKKDLKKLLSKIFDIYGGDITVEIANKIKDLGLHYSTRISNVTNIMNMKSLVKGIDLENISFKQDSLGEFKGNLRQIPNLYRMVDSGVISINNMHKILGIYNCQNYDSSEFEFKGNLIEGLQLSEYFISLLGLRNQKLNNMFNNLKKYNLMKSLYNSSQEVIVRADDCGTDKSIYFRKEEAKLAGKDFEEVINGRVLAKDVKDSDGTVILRKGEMINKKNINYILDDEGIVGIYYRSPLTCMSPSGVCQKCYGMDLTTRELVEVGVPVGIIAAQSIGESATLLAMNSLYHLGIVGGNNNLQGIDRIKQLFEMRVPKEPAVVAPFDGTIYFSEKGADKYVNIESDYMKKLYTIEDGYQIIVKKGDILEKGSDYAIKGMYKEKVHEDGIVIEVTKNGIIFGIKQIFKQSYKGLKLQKGIEEGRFVYKGQMLTNGTLDVPFYKDIVGDIKAQKYIINEVKKVYSDQGLCLNDRHIEVVVKQLFSKVFIEKPGEAGFMPGTYVKYEDFVKINKELEAQGKIPAEGIRLALGVTNIAQKTDSWLSAISFQDFIRVMVDASLKGTIDTLSDVKSNIIAGRLLPIGEQYRREHGFQ